MPEPECNCEQAIALKAENERLRGALERITRLYYCSRTEYTRGMEGVEQGTAGAINIAREALAPRKP